MILVHWAGKAVSDNAKTTRYRNGAHGNAAAYVAYRESVAWTIRQQAPGVRLRRPGLSVQFRLDRRCDAPNMLKGLLDGIQDSGIVANDRDIVSVEVKQTLPRAPVALDEAWLAFWETQP